MTKLTVATGNVQKEWRGFGSMKSAGIFLASLVFALLVVFVGLSNAVHAAPLDKVTQLSTGDETACAITEGKIACWGRGDSGQLGNDASKDASRPVFVVAKEGWTETIPARKECTLGIFCKTIPEKVVEHERTPLGGKYVTKISVGKNHACAIASARVYCWGNNSSGQLGIRSTNSSNKPVAVDISGVTPAKPGYCNGRTNGITGCGFPTGNWVNEVPAVPASSLERKEIIDIAAGDSFTCALASDGAVSCWGEGDDGRLGTNSTNDSHYPKLVHTAAGSALSGKAGVRLAKAANETMCVLAITKGQANNGAGAPYCWGKGIDDGRGIPPSGPTVVACNKSSPTTKPSTTTKVTIFNSKQPTAVPGATLTAIDGQDYVTGLGTDKKAYYWGMYGYQEVATYSNVKTCKVNPCTGKVTIQRDVELAGWKTKSDKTNRPRNSGPVGSRPKQTSQTTNGRTRVTNYSDGGQKVEVRDRNKGSNSCNLVTRYGFTKNVANSPVGQKVTTTPPTWPQSQGDIKSLSGGVFTDKDYKGLFCAHIGSGVQCDAHGAKTTSGQLGNGSSAQMNGPQNVLRTGWLADKQVALLSTGSTNDNASTGFTCTLASGSVGCWGVNSRGQLGVGDKKIRNAPTGVEY